ncbi:flagellar basal-body MS-ring/collar protein FliF [Desulfotruncus alcoholivorax]|uniref:flagellar basal-body MS-ring/collar protein FliF n=1 Tax=Desulfotruncus alcoholivorax TaxID=265477 RepID=UPI00040BA78D|nr:flagellar basal-body MS-ring/collar protein FliF [Desulfotruncus alcoholivorax]
MSDGILAKFRQWWQSLKQPQKILFAVGCLGILITIGILGQVMMRPTYAPLFTELEPKDAAKIIEQLESTKTPYRLTNNGKNIEVPEDQVYKLRIDMASAGVFNDSGVGFELFDQKKFGITDFEQQVGYQRALQEELRRTIVQLDEVEDARVHLVLPKESLFLDEKVTPSAAIALKLKNNVELDPEKVKAVQSLVMGSVQGLTPENIHIIDTQGKVLNDSLASNSGDRLSAASLERFDIQKKYEKELETRVQQMLNRVLGPGRAVAMVVAELDFDQQQTVRTEHGPGAVLSQETAKEGGSGTSPGGVPGTDSQMPGNSMPFADTGTGSQYTKEQQTTNYEVDTTQQTTVKAAGGVKRLSVSVVVDGDYTQAKLDSIQQIVAAAVGYDAARGDQLTVSSMPFNNDLLSVFNEPAANQTQKTTLLSRVYLLPAGAAAGLLILLAVILLLRRRARRRKEMLLQLQAEEEERLRLAQEREMDEKMVFEEPKPGYRAKIQGMATEKPGVIAEILKIWLRE